MAGARIQLKRGTASQWTAANTVLFAGEIGYETDTAKFKIGNGSTAWNSLGYSNANLGSASLDALSDVTITSAANGDFLRWNGSAWINDAVNLATDTIGSYVESLVAGTGISVTNNSGEGATPTVSLNASLDNVSDVTITSPEEFQSLVYNGSSFVNQYASVVTYVRNAEATTLTTGTVVYLFGATGDHATVKRADNDSDATSSKTVGLVAASIASAENGPVVTRGYVDGINLSVGYSSGDVLWLGEDGAFTKTKPTAPEHLVFVGVVVRATENGIVYVATQNGYELDELHDVSIVDKTSGDFLKYNGTIWVNDPINLGTDTTGNYMSDLTQGTGVTITHTPGEGSNATIAIGQAVGTTSNVQFNDVTVDGNLTVNGTTTTLNTETLAVEDNIIVLNSGVTGSPSANAGVEVERGTSSNVSIRWNETTDKWESTNDGTTYGNIVTSVDSGTVTSAMIADGTIVNDDISASAGIVDTKLATISTAGKVSNSATTATEANTANAIVARDASGNFAAGTITGALSGNASTATTLATARTIAGQSFNGSANISIAPTDLTGVTSTAAEINILDGATLSTAELNILDGVTATTAELNILDGVTSTTFELNILDGVTASATELNILDGALLSTTELNYLDGVTSSVQSQLDAKAPLNAPTFTGTVSGISKSMVGLGNVDNTSDANKPVSTAQQTALDLKANLASPTFTGTPSLPTGTTAVTQTLGNNTTAIATTEFIQTALANIGGMTVSDTAPTVDVSTGDFWYDSTGLNLYIYYSSSWVQVTIDEPIFFELSELIGVVIDDLLPNQTLRFDGVSGNWVNSAPRQNIANSSLTTYGVTSTNSGNMIVLDSSSAVSVNLGTWTDANVGEKVDIVQKGTGQVTVTVSGSVSVVSPGNSVTTRARYSTVTATCIETNLFLLSGDLA